MQVASSENLRFIGSQVRQKEENTFYFISLVDETGETFKLFSDELVFSVARGLAFGDPVVAGFEVTNGRDNLRIRLSRLEPIRI